MIDDFTKNVVERLTKIETKLDRLISDQSNQIAASVSAEARIKSLEEDRSQFKGGWKGLLAAGVLGGAVGNIKTILAFFKP